MDWSGAILTNSDLSNANLAGANLAGCDLRQCNFTEANLEGATLKAPHSMATHTAYHLPQPGPLMLVLAGGLDVRFSLRQGVSGRGLL